EAARCADGVDVQPRDRQLEGGRQVVVEPREIGGDEDLQLRHPLRQESISAHERDALGGRAVEREARLVELNPGGAGGGEARQDLRVHRQQRVQQREAVEPRGARLAQEQERDRKSTRLNSSHVSISYAVFCWKK